MATATSTLPLLLKPLGTRGATDQESALVRAKALVEAMAFPAVRGLVREAGEGVRAGPSLTALGLAAAVRIRASTQQVGWLSVLQMSMHVSA